MAYIEAHQSLLTHRKTLRLGRLLGMDRFCVVGRLLALWWWALDNAQEGYVAASDADILADVMGWSGEVAVLCDALVGSGFMELVKVNGEDAFIIHDWYDYAGNLLEKRKSNAERMRRARASSRQSNEDARAMNVRRTCNERAGANQTKPNVPYPTVSSGEMSEDSETQDIRRDSPEDSGADAPPPVAAVADAGDAPAVSPSVNSITTPASTLAPTPAPKLRAVYGEESEAMQLARTFARGLREVKPDVKLPRDGLQGWAREFDLTLRVDHRPREKIEAVMAYHRQSSFWRGVIFSARTLREKYDRLDQQMQEDAQHERERVSSDRRRAARGYAAGPARGRGSASGSGSGSQQRSYPKLDASYYDRVRERERERERSAAAAASGE